MFVLRKVLIVLQKLLSEQSVFRIHLSAEQTHLSLFFFQPPRNETEDELSDKI
jgi:hypothetical protein